VGVKDSSYNLYENLKLENFSIFPGSETKLLKGLELGCSGIITATCNVTAELSRKVYDDFISKKTQTDNQKLIDVRTVFDNYNLISGLHTYCAQENDIFKNILPPLSLLNKDDEKELFEKLKKLNFKIKSSLAA
jgi:4-hydroxy-tetrahydrodipicolinate synthase